MSFLDLFRAPAPVAVSRIVSPFNRPACDITKTALIVELFRTAHNERNGEWYRTFYDNVASASFACGEPQLRTGPDGFPYFVLRTPPEDRPFESFCIRNMMTDFLLDQGWGVVFNPNEDDAADWVFTHGDIVNLHLNNRFRTETSPDDVTNIRFNGNVGKLVNQEQVIAGQPSGEYLPQRTRAALRRFLKTKGIRRPKLLLLASTSHGKTMRRLVLNIHPEDYPISSRLDHLMQQVGWFLPNDYLLCPLPRNSSLRSGLADM